MNVFRKNKIPSIYLSIPWIREEKQNIFCDCLEDILIVKQMKSICSGKTCLSAFDDIDHYHIAASFPDDWRNYYGESEENIIWSDYHWKVWDVLYLIDNTHPYEAVNIRDTYISYNYLDSIEEPISCIPILKELRKISSFDNLTSEKINKIEEIEKKLFTVAKLRKMKGSANYIAKTKEDYSDNKNISAKTRKEILGRDNYKCIFCGNDSSEKKLEVDHIIPRSLVKRLSLNSELNSAVYNLCTTCYDCNRGKRDNLTKEDVEYYLEKLIYKEDFIPIIEYLEKIKDLQNK